ncbi:MAG: hypothetical protein Phog2KO_29880 [Phototrophicaceae bacterium]
MTFRTQWLDEIPVLHTVFEDSTSMSELNLVMLEYLGAAQEQEVHFLLDFTGINVPTNILKLPALLQVINHGNTKWLCLVKPETRASYMTRLLSRDKVKTFRKTDNAISFLQGMILSGTDNDLGASV